MPTTKRWKPTKNQKYFYVVVGAENNNGESSNYRIEMAEWECNMTYNFEKDWKMHNVFPTRREASLALKRVLKALKG